MNSEIGRKRRDLLDMEGNPVSLNMTEILWVPKPAEIGRSDSEEEDTVRSEDFDRSEVFDSEFSLRSKEEAEERFKFLVKVSQKNMIFLDTEKAMVMKKPVTCIVIRELFPSAAIVSRAMRKLKHGVRMHQKVKSRRIKLR